MKGTRSSTEDRKRQGASRDQTRNGLDTGGAGSWGQRQIWSFQLVPGLCGFVQVLSSEDVSAETMGNIIEQNDRRSNNYMFQIQDLRMFLMDKLP